MFRYFSEHSHWKHVDNKEGHPSNRNISRLNNNTRKIEQQLSLNNGATYSGTSNSEVQQCSNCCGRAYIFCPERFKIEFQSV